MEGDALAFDHGDGMAKAVITDGSHATRQDVAEISSNKLDAFEGLHFGRVAVGAIIPAETHMTVADLPPRMWICGDARAGKWLARLALLRSGLDFWATVWSETLQPHFHRSRCAAVWVELVLESVIFCRTFTDRTDF